MNTILTRYRPLLPGIALSAIVTVLALIIAEIEEAIIGYALLEPLVLALLLGLVIRNAWNPPAPFQPGIGFSGKQMLEFAIVLLGASLDFHSLVDAGFKLLLAIALMVTTALVAGTIIGRTAGLETRQAILIAVGNAICGNSAIAAVAPAIRATKQQIASAISLTAVFGIGVVLVLPLFKAAIEMSDERYGVFAGMTVYAVPQVLAATFPVSAISGQFGSLTKLTRVLFLGPVVAIFAFIYREKDEDGASTTSLSVTKLFPWFIIGFVLLMILRSIHIIPDEVGHRLQDVSKILTAIAMAALGLSVDVRSVRSTGSRVFTTVAILTALLLVVAFTLVTVLSIG